MKKFLISRIFYLNIRNTHRDMIKSNLKAGTLIYTHGDTKQTYKFSPTHTHVKKRDKQNVRFSYSNIIVHLTVVLYRANNVLFAIPVCG